MKLPKLSNFIFVIFSISAGTYQIKAQSLELPLDSIWQNVIAIDNDSSLSAFNYRETEAKKMFKEWGNTQSVDALVFALGTWLRNKNHYRILKIVESFDVNTEAWDVTFLFYRKAFYGICRYCHEDYILKLNEWLPLAGTAERKSKILIDKAYAFHALSQAEKERECYQKILELDLPDNNPVFRKAKAGVATLKLLIGMPAPNFTVQSHEGRKISSQELRGKIIFLHFWATWCRPCLDELPTKRSLFELYGKREEVVFIGVNMDIDNKRLEKYLEQNPLPWPQVWVNRFDENDQNYQELADFGAYASIPRSFIIDGDGDLFYSSEIQERSKEVLFEAFKKLIKK